MKKSLSFEQYRESLVLHPAFETTANQVIDAIYSHNDEPIIAVYGPPGVGKTSLIRFVLSKVIEQEFERMEQDREYIPIVGVRVPSPETRQFPWRDCYHTMIEGLFDPASRAEVNFRNYKTKPLQRGLGFEFPTEKYLGRGTKQTLYRHFLRIL
ncbi:MAG: AAA family ATPase, partial [Coraliomargarita sp.]